MCSCFREDPMEHLQHALCLKKHSQIIDWNSNKDYWILIIFFRVNIPDTNGHQRTIQVPIAPKICFCTTRY